MLQIENLCLTVPGKTLLNDLCMHIRPGECWGVLGANGSGKSSLLHALSGLKMPQSGNIRLAGRLIQSYGVRERARRIGILLQEYQAAFYDTVFEYVLLGRYAHARGWAGRGQTDVQYAEDAIAALELQSLQGRLLPTLSGGERQRARIAQLFAQDTPILCLDEPLQHLDVRHQQRVMTSLRELAYNQQKAVIIVLHDPLWAGRYCDHVLLLYEGGAAECGLSDDVLTSANLQRLYQCVIREVNLPEGKYYVPA